MVKQAVEFLSRSRVHNIDMLEPLSRGNAQVLYAGEDGVLLLEKTSGIPMLSAETLSPALLAVLEQLGTPELFVTHDEKTVAPLMQRFGLSHAGECFQCAYPGQKRLSSPDSPVRALGVEYAPEIHCHYTLVDDLSYIEERCRAGVMHGILAPETGELAGFIGMHTEGSLGLLMVLPSYRRRGYAEALQRYMTDFCLNKGYVPFGQVFRGNEASLSLQRKLGYEISDGNVYWLSRGAL